MRNLTLLLTAGSLLAAGPAPAETIRGVVRDEAGKPVAGVEVEAIDPRHPPLSHGGPPRMRAVTDPEGRYTITNAHPGSLLVGASGQDVLPSKPKQADVTAQQELSVDLVTARAVTLSGVVLDPSGKPARRAFLYAQESFGLRRSYGTSEEEAANQGSARADNDGRFLIRGLPPGTIHLRVSADGLPETLTTATAPGKDVVVKLISGASLSGEVVDAEGKPLAGASVQLSAFHPRDRMEALGGQGDGRTGADGRFKIDGLLPDSYWLVAEDRDRREWFARVEVPSDKPVQVAFPKLQEISGKVTNDSGLPLEKFKVSAYWEVDDDQRAGRMPALMSNSATAQVQADGSFHLTGLVPGRYKLFASAYVDKAHAESPGVVVDAGSSGVSLTVAPPVQRR